MLLVVSLYSYYNYDPSGEYLTSVTTGGVTLEYTYDDEGDLTSATDKFGANKTFSYDENKWIKKIETFDSNSTLMSSTSYKTSWNGRMEISEFPKNTSHTLVHDKRGNVVSIATDNGLPEMSIELPYGRKRVLGDEVSSTPF